MLTVPALVYLLHQPVEGATTGALAIVTASAAVGAAASADAGAVDARVALMFAGPGAAGALLGSVLNRLATEETILSLLALVMLASAHAIWRGAPARAGASARRPRRQWPLLGALGLAVGVMTGFFGVGGGFLIVSALVLLVGLPVRVAVGTSLLVIAVTALVGLVGHLGAGGVALPLIGTFAGAGMVGVLAGVRLGRRIDTRTLSRAFALSLVALAAALLVANVGW